MLIHLLAQVDPQKALHDYWKTSIPEAHLATTTTGFAAFAAGMNPAAVVAFVGVAIPVIFGVIVQCWKQVRIASIEIREKQFESDDRIAARRAAALDAKTQPPQPSRGDGTWVLAPDTRPSG